MKEGGKGTYPADGDAVGDGHGGLEFVGFKGYAIMRWIDVVIGVT